jgi:hypothetical protein
MFTITWCTRYNGVYVSLDTGEYPDGLEEILDELANTLPSYTYMFAQPWEYQLDENQKNFIKFCAMQKLLPKYPDLTLGDFKFESDENSS